MRRAVHRMVAKGAQQHAPPFIKSSVRLPDAFGTSGVAAGASSAGGAAAAAGAGAGAESPVVVVVVGASPAGASPLATAACCSVDCVAVVA